jgi:predicted enzyme related to lactoylglutathione lyase
MEGSAQEHAGRIVWRDHVSSSAEEGAAFYAAVLGWELERWEHGEISYPMIRRGGHTHGGFVSAAETRPNWLVYVRVGDLEATMRTVADAGGAVRKPPAPIPEVGRFAVCADPAGATFAAVEDAGGPEPSRDAFAWDEVYVRDLDAATAFYGRVFGWTTAPFNEGYTVLKRGEATVGGLMALPEALPRPGWLTYAATDDVDGAAARAAERGAGTILAPTDVPNVGRVAVLVDPFGAPFGLYGDGG